MHRSVRTSSLSVQQALPDLKRRKTVKVDTSRVGMAMLAVLCTLVIAAILASAVAQQARSSYRLDVEHHQRTREDWLLQAGLNRAVKALITPGDAMREALFSAHPASLALDGTQVMLAMSAESEKVDVNAADPERVMEAVALALPRLSPDEVAYVLAHLAASKARKSPVSSPELLLPLARRSLSVADQLRRTLTTLSGQRFPSQPRHDHEEGDDTTGRTEGLSQLRAESIGPPSRPIYRLTATMTAAGSLSGAVPASATVVIILSVNDTRTFKIAEGHL
jgi:type II secretory pathway pseudopilin PulG